MGIGHASTRFHRRIILMVQRRFASEERRERVGTFETRFKAFISGVGCVKLAAPSFRFQQSIIHKSHPMILCILHHETNTLTADEIQTTQTAKKRPSLLPKGRALAAPQGHNGSDDAKSCKADRKSRLPICF